VKTRPQKKTLEFFRETTLRAKDELELKFGTLGAEQRGTKIKGGQRERERERERLTGMSFR
jgi:hypothetical protein